MGVAASDSARTEDMAAVAERFLAGVNVQILPQHGPHQRLEAMEVHYTLDNDAELVPALIVQLQPYLVRFGICDAGGCVRVGIALEEAVSNAIHHGNLELSSALREEGTDSYDLLAQARRREAPFMHRRVRIRARFSHDEAVYIIRDEGPGFDPQAIPDPTDPANLDQVSGRGLLLMRSFMDEVAYNAVGNELTMVKRRQGRRSGSLCAS